MRSILRKLLGLITIVSFISSAMVVVYAWDVSTASFPQFSVNSQENNPQALSFNTDGTKMFVSGATGDDVNEYTCTAFNASTCSFVDSFSVSSQDTSPQALSFNTDGTKMFVVGLAGQDVNEYTLSTGFDVSTASFVDAFSISGQETFPTGLSFDTDGTKMFVVGEIGDDVNEYTLSTGFDVSTASFVDSFSISSQETSPKGLSFNTDGTKMFITGQNGDDVNEYTLSTGFDVSTASFVDSFSVSAQDQPAEVTFNSDGTKMFVLGDGLNAVYEYTLSTGFDVSSAIAFSQLDIIAQETKARGTFFKPDGTRMYLVGYSGRDINEYTLSTAWQIGTASYSRSFSVASQETDPNSVHFNPDGTKMFVVGFGGDDINEYTLSDAWNVTTASFVDSLSVQAKEAKPLGMAFKADGTKVYVVGSNSDSVHEYNLSVAWDISTGSFNQSFSIVVWETSPHGLDFKDDGTRMYVIGHSGDDVNEFSLSTAWDVSTASFVQTKSIVDQETVPTGVSFGDDGTKMYVIGQNSDTVFQYTVTPYAGVTLSTTTVAVTEGGATSTYTVVLDRAPTADVVVTVSPDSDTTVSTSTLTFTTSNWDTAQSVVVTAVDDDDVETNPHNSTISHAASSSDEGYDGISIDSVTASVTENDLPLSGDHLESVTFDTGATNGFTFNSIYWEGSLPSGSQIKFQLAVSTSTDFSNVDFKGADGTIADSYSASDSDGGESIPINGVHHNPFTADYRYFRYRVFLSKTGDSPVVSKVVVNWSK